VKVSGAVHRARLTPFLWAGPGRCFHYCLVCRLLTRLPPTGSSGAYRLAVGATEVQDGGPALPP